MVQKRYRPLVPLLILAAGLLGMLALSGLEKDLPEKTAPSQRLLVRTMTAEPAPLNVTLSGWGEVRTVNTVCVSSEVTGRLAYVNPRLKQGQVLSKGSLLFQVDKTRFRHALERETAVKSGLENQIRALEVQQETDKVSLNIARRNRDLALAEFNRRTRLYAKHAESKSRVDKGEETLNQAETRLAELSGAVKKNPFDLALARNRLKQSLARLALIREDLARCRIPAPMDGRVTSVNVQTGQYVTPGQPLATLADDTLLEIHVSLDSRDARDWLVCSPGPQGVLSVKPVDCRVFRERESWPARMHRVVTFDSRTRSLVVAVRLSPDPSGTSRLPIAEGMFCRVEIPGRTRQGIFCLPAEALRQGSTVFIADRGRARKKTVTIIWKQDEHVFAHAGLARGDQVILTPLAATAEAMPITIIPKKGDAQ